MFDVTERRPGLRQRRFAVVLLYLSLLAGVVGSFWWRDRQGPVELALALAVLTAFVGALVMLFRHTHYWHWGNAPDYQLDEFEVAARAFAYRFSYHAVAAVSIALLILFQFVEVPRQSQGALVWNWLLFVLTLPAAVLAWRERPPVDED
jgi:hypothetical protein